MPVNISGINEEGMFANTMKCNLRIDIYKHRGSSTFLGRHEMCESKDAL